MPTPFKSNYAVAAKSASLTHASHPRLLPSSNGACCGGLNLTSTTLRALRPEELRLSYTRGWVAVEIEPPSQLTENIPIASLMDTSTCIRKVDIAFEAVFLSCKESYAFPESPGRKG